MADVPISSTRGGQNDFDSAIHLSEDQCTSVLNVEWTSSTDGERRLGGVEIDITGSDLVGHERITFLDRHLPTTLSKDAELWALGVTGTSSSDLCRKTTVWGTVTVFDDIVLTSSEQYKFQGQSLHGKFFTAYKSDEDRLHVWDGASHRRTGLAEPAAAPTVVATGSAGSFAGERFYRVRYITMSGSTVLRRSEPSEAESFTPDGTKTGAVVTRPALINEGETHWELEASLNDGDYYVIATTIVATTTATDTTAFSPGYADRDLDFELSPDIGDYSVLPACRFMVVDRDRLVTIGSPMVESDSCRVLWTPVSKSIGVGNDERWEADTDPRLDLDTQDGGAPTGAETANGSIYIFKLERIYKLTATGFRARAYEPRQVSGVRGAIEGSTVKAVDENGNDVIYFLDPNVGPCRLGIDGLRQCGRDIRTTWGRVNKDATIAARSLFHPEKNQVMFWVAVDGGLFPSRRLVLHTDYTTPENNQIRKGWAVWDGASAAVLAVCLYSENIDDDTDRSLELRPFIGREAGADDSLIWRLDTGNTDNGAAYHAAFTTRPQLRRMGHNKFAVMSGMIAAKAAAGVTIDVTVVGNLGETAVEKSMANLSLAPADAETTVFPVLDDVKLNDIRSVQVTIEDSSPATGRWEIEFIVLSDSTEQRAT